MICTSCIHTNRYFYFTEEMNHFVLWITSGTKQYGNASVSSFLTVDIFFKQCQVYCKSDNLRLEKIYTSHAVSLKLRKISRAYGNKIKTLEW